ALRGSPVSPASRSHAGQYARWRSRTASPQWSIMDDAPSLPGQVDLERLATDLCPALYAWARLRLPASLRNLISAEDVVQEVWLRVVRLNQTRSETRGAN